VLVGWPRFQGSQGKGLGVQVTGSGVDWVGLVVGLVVVLLVAAVAASVPMGKANPDCPGCDRAVDCDH